MKTQWDFQIETHGIVVRKDREFVGEVCPGKPDAIPFQMQLTRETKYKPARADDAARLSIRLPGKPEDTESYAHVIAAQFTERLAFPRGRVRILGGLIVAKMIPESAEEEAELGENRFFARLSFQEVVGVPPVESRFLSGKSPGGDAMVVLQQFNASKDLDNPVDRFLGLFKAVEKAFCSTRGSGILKNLRDSEPLFEIASTLLKRAGTENEPIGRSDFDDFLVRLVRVRDNCAHLRGKTGYAPSDPALATDVVPQAEFLAQVTEKYIGRCLDEAPYSTGRGEASGETDVESEAQAG